MIDTPFDAIKKACRRVAEGATHVRINPERLRTYAESLNFPAVLEFDPTCHFIGSDEATLTYIVILDAINFGSGWFPDLKKLNGHGGYYTIATHLKRAFERNGPFTTRYLTGLTAESCAILFDQGGAVPELMKLFAAALAQLGTFIDNRFDGSFLKLIQTAGHSAAALITLLQGMPNFADSAVWHGQSVPLLKRAQIMAWDLHLAFRGEGLGRFDDIEALTIFADNLVPHVLRVDGVLEYDAALARRIDAGELIAAGSEEEIELRAVAVHVAQLMAQHRGISAARLDYHLWNMGQEARYQNTPAHRTRTIFY